MANAAIFLFDLKTGRCSSTIQVRLLCFLEPMNVRWGSELMGVDMFLPDSQLLGLANTNTQLPDIIGEVTAAKSTVTDPPHDKNRLMATIKMDNDVSVTMSMFDSQPVKLHNKLESMGGDPRVLVATSINPKIVGGTRIYFDEETIAGETSTGWLPKTLGLRQQLHCLRATTRWNP
uniref:Uncharacterized protein n=1 Tax=Brassica oleracea TaxID=3712 RepID=A0A3P6G786_BRAOL|nr:unnamed protein product [Brassica oleracea]